jgi:hypothetical protein
MMYEEDDIDQVSELKKAGHRRGFASAGSGGGCTSGCGRGSGASSRNKFASSSAVEFAGAPVPTLFASASDGIVAAGTFDELREKWAPLMATAEGNTAGEEGSASAGVDEGIQKSLAIPLQLLSDPANRLLVNCDGWQVRSEQKRLRTKQYAAYGVDSYLLTEDADDLDFHQETVYRWVRRCC